MSGAWPLDDRPAIGDQFKIDGKVRQVRSTHPGGVVFDGQYALDKSAFKLRATHKIWDQLPLFSS